MRILSSVLRILSTASRIEAPNPKIVGGSQRAKGNEAINSDATKDYVRDDRQCACVIQMTHFSLPRGKKIMYEDSLFS